MAVEYASKTTLQQIQQPVYSRPGSTTALYKSSKVNSATGTANTDVAIPTSKFRNRMRKSSLLLLGGRGQAAFLPGSGEVAGAAGWVCCSPFVRDKSRSSGSLLARHAGARAARCVSLGECHSPYTCTGSGAPLRPHMTWATFVHLQTCFYLLNESRPRASQGAEGPETPHGCNGVVQEGSKVPVSLSPSQASESWSKRSQGQAPAKHQSASARSSAAPCCYLLPSG